MRREHGVLVFENRLEQNREIRTGFQGIFVQKHPSNDCYWEIFEILNEGRAPKPIGIIYNCYYSWLISEAEVAKELRRLKYVVLIETYKNLPAALEMGIPEIAISADLEHELFHLYKK